MDNLSKKEMIAAKVAAGIFASGRVGNAPDFRQIALDSVKVAEAILKEIEQGENS